MSIKSKLITILILIGLILGIHTGVILWNFLKNTREIQTSNAAFERLLAIEETKSTIEKQIREVTNFLKTGDVAYQQQHDQYKAKIERSLKDLENAAQFFLETREQGEYIQKNKELQSQYHEHAQVLSEIIALVKSEKQTEAAERIAEKIGKSTDNTLFATIQALINQETERLDKTYDNLLVRAGLIPWVIEKVGRQVRGTQGFIDYFLAVNNVQSHVLKQMIPLATYSQTSDVEEKIKFQEQQIEVEREFKEWRNALYTQMKLGMISEILLENTRETEGSYRQFVEAAQNVFSLENLEVTANTKQAVKEEAAAFANEVLLPAISKTIDDSKQRMQAAHHQLLEVTSFAGIQSVILLLIVSFVVVILSINLIRGMLISLNKLRDGIEIIGKGKLDHRIGLKSRDELGQLAVSFDNMTEEVEERTARLKMLNEQLQQEMADRKQIEEERTRLAAAVEQAAESIIITDVKGTIQYVNPFFERLTGYTYEEAVGNVPGILKSGKHDREFYRKMWQTIARGNVWKGHFINKKKDGTLYEEEATISPLRDENGKIVNYVAVKHDMTYEVQMEKSLRHSHKMEALGTLAGGIAHDFNNLLFGMICYITAVRDSLPDESELRKHLQEALQAGMRAKNLIGQILDFSRQKEQEFQTVQIIPLIKESIKLLRASLPSTIEIHQKIDPHCSNIKADPTQIHQLLMNLCTNASHAMQEGGGILEVELSETTIGQDFSTLHEIKSGTYLKLTLRDTGSGMPPDILDRIFDPFFTTKPVGEGSGMGLAVVHSIVKNHGGTITVSSETGQGSTFEIFIPTTVEISAESEAAEIIPEGKEKILLVDDEEIVITGMKLILENFGYEVTATTNSEEALHIFQAQPDRFELIITDETMPKMTGVQLIKSVRTIRPDIPIILVTGFSESISQEQAKQMGIQEYLVKPVFDKDLSNAIQRALHSQLLVA